ncbi:MAG TPA: N-acetyltransferase [Caldithrix abyssi]|uniref:N-acetyltransferase n=1 Tax=Caldithrix abyssi TaxID=187145 RepID=A0A7V5RNG8_CALAY|nr:N-acetyltransferase [Caldithrix abyssi]
MDHLSPEWQGLVERGNRVSLLIVISMEEFILREYREKDMPFVIRLLGESPALTFYPPEKIAEHARIWLEEQITSYKTHGFGVWLLESAKGESLGQCGLMMREIEERPRIELGFSIRLMHRGKGWATRAGLSVIEWARQKGLRELTALTSPENDPAQRVLRHCGFSLQGRTERFGEQSLLYRRLLTD